MFVVFLLVSIERGLLVGAQKSDRGGAKIKNEAVTVALPRRLPSFWLT